MRSPGGAFALRAGCSIFTCRFLSSPLQFVVAPLCSILPDEPDARMIAIGEGHRQDSFMTDDRASVLKHREQIASVCSIKARRPTELLAELVHRST
jgi:hypothetical protein